MKKILIAILLMPLMALADTWTDPVTGIEWRFMISQGAATVGTGDFPSLPYLKKQVEILKFLRCWADVPW